MSPDRLSRRFLRATAAIAACAALLLDAGAANAGQVLNYSEPYTAAFANPCDKEIILFTGTLHYVLNVTQDGSQGFHIVVSIGMADMKGVDERGNGYVLTDAGHMAFHVAGDYAVSAVSDGFSSVVVSQGAAPNFSLRGRLHLTYANGDYRAAVEDLTPECRG
jgi:hypothetical protein